MKQHINMFEVLTYHQFANENSISKEASEKIENLSKSMKHPVVIHKGVDGKIDPNGEKINVHSIPDVVFGSYEFKRAKKYDRGGGVDTFLIDTNKIERIKAPTNLGMKAFREKEIELIKSSKADIVELDTVDANGKELQIVVKTPDKLVKICNTK